MQKTKPNTYLLILTLNLSLFCVVNTWAQKKDLTVDEYIATYKDIAIQEMERSGIPASITLAQGIHESGYGNSLLAKKANNHFGIKCTSDWKGEEYFKWDDEANKSCFRVYKSAISSYIDHTDFLMKRKHYASLFKYDRTEYKKWARGLKKAGYATDPKYPDKLIHTIEKNNLNQYDKATGVLAFDPKDIPTFDADNQSSKFRTKPRSFLFAEYKKGSHKKNDVSFFYTKKGESALAFAQRFGIPYKKILRFNDLEDGDQLIEHQYGFIQPKKNSYHGSESFHKVKMDETMYEIAQYYGVKLNSLQKKNLLSTNEEPANGALILLKQKAAKKPALRASNHIDTLPPLNESKKSNTKLKTSDTKSSTTKGKVVIPKIERPKPVELEINTPTYSDDIYNEKKTINTAKSKDTEYLELKVSKGETGANTQTDNNPYGPNTSTKKDDNPTTNVNNSNNSPNINNNALFGWGNNSNSTSNNTTNPNTNTNNNSNPYNSNSTTTTTNPYNPNPTNNNTTNVNTNNNTSINTTTNNSNSAKYQMHIVQKGETLFALYRKYQVSVNTIKTFNNLTSDSIRLGDQIKIPLNK